mgnify:CR=1 FL=1
MRVVFFNEAGTLRSGWKALAFFLVFSLLGAGTGFTFKLLGWGRGLGVWASVAVGLATSAICVRLEGRRLRDLGFSWGVPWLRDLALGALGGALLIALTALVVRGAGGFHVGLTALLTPLWFWLGVAFNEELITRGYPFQRLAEGAGTWVAQAVFATLFALGHWGNPGMHGAAKAWATLNISLAALLLGFAYLRTRSLALPIGIHLGWNWAQGSLLGFGVSGTTPTPGLFTPHLAAKPQWLTGGAFGLEASLPCAVICALAVLGLGLWKGSARVSGGASTASGS